MGFTGYGISFAKKPMLSHGYANGGRIYKVMLNASLDHFINEEVGFTQQSDFVKRVCAGFVKFIDNFSGEISKVQASKFVKVGVVGSVSNSSYNVWDDSIIQITGVAELNGVGSGVDEFSNNYDKASYMLAYMWWQDYIVKGLSTEEAVQRITKSRKFDPSERIDTTALRMFQERPEFMTKHILDFRPISASYKPLHSKSNSRIIKSAVATVASKINLLDSKLKAIPKADFVRKSAFFFKNSSGSVDRLEAIYSVRLQTKRLTLQLAVSGKGFKWREISSGV